MTTPNDGNLLQRCWVSWCGFWFTPADPTPLCFMRIVAGLLTLYVHVAYSFDLVAMFGPDGWVSQAESNRIRHGMPHVRGRADWSIPNELQMPEDEADRKVLCDFANRLAAAPDCDANLFFMHSIGSAGEERNELLRYLQQPVDLAEFQAELRAFVNDQLSAEAKERGLPRSFQRQVTPEARKAFAETLLRYRQTLPDDFAARKRLLQLLMKTSAEDWEAFDRFVNDLRKLPAAERDGYLAKYADWQVSPKMVYAAGMPTYSPWFHTQDLRMLWLIHGLHLIAIFAFMVGFNTRVFAVITWVAGLSYIHRAQPYLFGQDTMMNLCLGYLMLSPCGAKWSVDRWLERKRAEAAGRPVAPVARSVSAGLVLRIFQIQFCLMYFSAGLSKLKGQMWWNGSAMHLCMANPEFSPMHVGVYQELVRWICSHRLVWELMGTGTSVFTLLTEITFPYLVWTRMRPILLSASLLLHAGIGILMGLSVFSLFMFTLLLCFFPADIINWMFGGEDDRKVLAH